MAQNFVQAKKTKLSGSGITSTATSIGLNFFTTPNDTEITDTELGTINYGTLEPGTSKEEIISFTGVTQVGDGTATLTGVTRGLDFVYPYTAVSVYRQSHAGNTVFIMSNNPQMYEDMVSGANDETITGEYTFPEGGDTNAPKSGTSYSEPTDDLEYASKKYIDDVAISGGVKATDSIYGIAKLSTAAVSATEPIVVGDNDSRIPTTDEKAALVGTDEIPSASHPFVNNELTTTSAGAGDEGKIGLLNASGEYDRSMLGDLISTINADTLTNGSDADALHSHGTIDALKIIGFNSDSTWYTFQVPFDLGSNTNWDSNNLSNFSNYAGGVHSSSIGTLYTNITKLTNSTTYSFGDTKKIIITFPFAHDGGNSDTGDCLFVGLGNSSSAIASLADTLEACIGFLYQQHSGNFYVKTCNGTNQENTEISGWTQADSRVVHNFRIEVDESGGDVRYYIDGVLKATHTTYVPNSGTAYLKWTQEAATNVTLLVPTISMEI